MNMKQRHGWLFAVLSVLTLMTIATAAVAEDNNLSGHVEIGVSGVDTKDNPARVNEYVRSRSEDGLSFAPKLSLQSNFAENSAFALDADIMGPRDQRFNLDFDAARVFRLKFDYQAMEYWQDRETLDQMGATGRGDTDRSQPSVTTDKIMSELDKAGYDIYTFIPANDPDGGVGGGTLNYDPLQAYRQELDNNYIVTRREWQGKADLTVPELPNVTFHAGMRVETREGMEQAIGVTKCDNCHVTAHGKTIDERTEDLTLGATGKFGILTVAYEYLTRKFTASGATPERYYEDATNNTAYNLLYEADDFPFARTPDSDKDSHSLKARLDLSNNTSITGSYVKADIESTKEVDPIIYGYDLQGGDTLSTEFESVGAKLSTRLGKNLRLALRANAYEIDTSSREIYFPAREVPAADLAWPYEATDAWHSAEGREVREVGFDAVYRLAKGTTLRLGYEYEEVERDEEELGETETHTVKVALKSRINKQFSGNVSYKYQDIDEPMAGAHVGIAQGDPTAIQDVTGDSDLWYYLTANFNPATTPTWYWTSVYPNRQLESTSLPDQVHEAKISGTWSPKTNLAATVFARYRYEENDDVDYEQTTIVPGLSLYYAPSNKANLTLAYTFNQQDTENRACVGWYHG
jgi:hypothetical protein